MSGSVRSRSTRSKSSSGCQKPGDFGPHRRIMYSSIVVGTDGSQTAGIAVAQAAELAAAVGATLDIVSAYHPVPKARLEAEAAEAPEDVRWAISPTILHVAEEQ